MKLKDVITAARPMLFEQDGEEYAYGGQGTGFFAVYKERRFLFSAAHVTGRNGFDTIRVSPNDESDTFVAFDRSACVPNPGDASDDSADVVCLRVEASLLAGRLGSSVRFLSLEQERILLPGDRLIVPGYPNEGRSVDYAWKLIRATGEMLGGEYVGPSVSPPCYELSWTETGRVTKLCGFSGSPVLFVEASGGEMIDAALVGMLVRGSLSSGKSHFLGVEVLRKYAEAAQ